MRHMNSCRFNPGIVRPCLAFVCLLWFGAVIVRALDHYVVPTNSGAAPDYETWAKAATNIQDAVNVATNGETVWLTNGTYFAPSNCVLEGAMVIITNAITVRSFSGSYTDTVVNGNWPACSNRVFLMSNAAAVVSGLTITNGFSTNLSGVGVCVYKAGLLTNCLIAGNIVTTKATGVAGIYMSLNTDSKVSHCIMKGNRMASGSDGSAAAIYCYGKGTITNCLIIENYNLGNGWAGACYINCNANNNSCVMQDCIVSNNSVANAVFFRSDNTPVKSRVIGGVIRNNTGNGVYFSNGGGTVRNCLIVQNGSIGIRSEYTAKIENCTIANHPSFGIYHIYAQSESYVLNTIIFHNYTGGTNNINLGMNVFYTNCCTYPPPDLGVNNITVTNPVLFVDTNSANYRLIANSPCINAGTNQTWMTNSYDLDGGVRVRYGWVDMGAYEHINKGTVYNFQ